MRRLSIVLALMVLCAAAAKVVAGNPRVTLQLTNVSARGAVEALAADTKLPLRFQDEFGADRAAPEQLSRRADFRWNNVLLSQALRDLCRTYGLKLYPTNSGYFLFYSSNIKPDPEPLATAEAEGTRLTLRQIETEAIRRVGTEEGNPSGPAQMSLVLEGHVPNDDAAAMMGLAKVTAKDDRGNVLVQDFGRVFGPNGRNLFPDEWRVGLSMTAPDPSARKLEWLEGDLMRAKVYEPFRFEASLPPEPPREPVEGITVEVTQLLPTPEAANGAVGNLRGPRIAYRTTVPNGTWVYTLGREMGLAPMLIGASGTTYRPYQTFDNGFSHAEDGRAIIRTYQATLPHIREPIKAVVFDGYRKSGQVKFGHFRMENIPLPVEAAAPPRRVATTRNSTLPEKRPYFDANGGVLRSRVLIGGKPAQEGVLAFGLSRIGEDAGVEWYEAPVDNIGVARVITLKPGEYRLFRIFHPKDTTVSLGEGEWKDSEIRIKLRAGREVEPDPLRWEKKRRKRD